MGLVNVIKTAGWICQSKLQSKVTSRQLLSCVILWRMDFRINCGTPRKSKALDCEHQDSPLCHKQELSQRPKESEYSPSSLQYFNNFVYPCTSQGSGFEREVKKKKLFKDSAPLSLGFLLKLLCVVHNKIYFFAGCPTQPTTGDVLTKLVLVFIIHSQSAAREKNILVRKVRVQLRKQKSFL